MVSVIRPNFIPINPSRLPFEEYRLQTFRYWSIQAPIPAERLAKAGFFYLGNCLEVVCVFCHGRISDWEFGDIPMEKHASRFPICSFVKNESNNIPIWTENAPSGGGAIFVNTSASTATLHLMRLESERLKSFIGKWNLDYIRPIDLAKAGFFYLHPPDKVQCAFCHGIVSDWRLRDCPYIQHVNHFGLCPFLMGRDVGNIPLEGDVIERRFRGINSVVPESTSKIEEFGVNIHQGPKHLSQVSKETRLESFISWPKNKIIIPEELADAGFFYTGISDNVICFYCDGGLCNWDVGDDPWVEHARWLPKCAFINLHKGGDFVQSSWDRHGNIQIPLQIPKSNDMNPTVDRVMISDMVKSFLKIQSHPPYLVRLAILRHLQETGTVVQNMDELCDVIHKVKDEKPSTPNEKRAQKSSDQTEEENDQLMCKICMTEEVKVVFLPCGHLIACIQCASALKNCALCRKPIKGSIRTFLS